MFAAAINDGGGGADAYGPRWDPRSAEPLGGNDITMYLHTLTAKYEELDERWLRNTLRNLIPNQTNETYNVPCCPISGLPFTFKPDGANAPSINRLNNEEG